MRYFTSGLSAARWRRDFKSNPQISALYSPLGWRNPFCVYACDNDVYAHRNELDWWEHEGEKAWLKMLDKIPATNPPQWVLLPDVVGDWPATIRRAARYRDQVNRRGFKCALALQDGAERDGFIQAISFGASTVFVGGTTDWKWRYARRIAQLFPLYRQSVHIGRVNGERAIRLARGMGVTSCDGTGISRHIDAMMPGFKRGLELPAANFQRAA